MTMTHYSGPSIILPLTPGSRQPFMRASVEGSEPSRQLFKDSSGAVVSRRPAVLPDIIGTEFARHERKWRRETVHVSSPIDKYLHPSYARIIGLGRPAVSYILNSMQKRPDDWFYALRAITGANPVPASAAGNMRRMTDLWLKWGRERGLI